MYVLRPGRHGVGRTGGVVIVVSGGDKDGDFDLRQGARQSLDRFVVDPVAVQQITGEQNHVGLGGAGQFRKAIQNLPLFRAALDGLLGT